MSRRNYALNLTAQERQTLEQLRDHHVKPYLRERASALLRIIDGQAASAVARQGVRKPRAAGHGVPVA